MLDILHLALPQGLLHRTFNLGAGAFQKPLAIAEALALRVLAAIDDVHQRFLLTPPRPRTDVRSTSTVLPNGSNSEEADGQARSAWLTAAGFSIVDMWPQYGTTVRELPRM